MYLGGIAIYKYLICSLGITYKVLINYQFFDQSPVLIQTKFKSKLLTNFYKMSSQIVYYLCKSSTQKSCAYNIQLGYNTKFVCSIECHMALKAYIDAQYKYNNTKIGNSLIY